MNRSVGEVVVLVVVLISAVRWPFPSSQTNRIGPASAGGLATDSAMVSSIERPAPQAVAKKQKQWHRQKRRKARVAGDKRGANKDRFYRDLIQLADSRFAGHLAT